jgi:uncharacterized membrane protein
MVLGLATLTTGLVAGVYYAFACAVMLGLGRTADRVFIEVMRRINESIENPVFFAAFFGALVLSVAAVVQQRRRGRQAAARWAVAALVCYLLGFLVTVGANVPLNEQLAAGGPVSRLVDPAAVRQRFETPWLAWNIVRTLASTAALGCLARTLVLHGRSRRDA